MNPLLWVKNGKIVIQQRTVPETEISPRSVAYRSSGNLYLLAILCTNAVIWTGAFLYLKKAEVIYQSDWSITIPGAGSSTNINLPNIGEASSQNSSAYAVSSFDPRENYKAIATSEQVLNVAADRLHMSSKDFGIPKIKILDNTTLMSFELQGSTPKEARDKSIALYNALSVRLSQLRTEEINQQNVRLQQGIEQLRKKLKVSQMRLSEYKAISGLNSNEQISNLAINIEGLRKQRAELMAQVQQHNANLAELSENLNLSSYQASSAFVLQADQLFQKYLQSYNESKTKLISLNSKFLPDHPTIIAQQLELNQAQAALINRAQALLGRSFDISTIDKLSGNNDAAGSKRAALSEKLVSSQVESQGSRAQVQELDRQINLLENRLKVLTQRGSTLEDLKRDVQVSEAVFSSTIAKLDLANSSVSASYPPIQIVSKPSLPEESAGPKKKLVLLGAALGSMFTSSGVLTLWWRNSSLTEKAFIEE